ncbi:hypothetical protein KSP40_PGU009660 [Platanthera guangdongensis]|uniref:UDP-MurNAc-pentapeptide synthetase n=1 Tax=Platanthera guangdongensis TaxID=2320717 RepID=A0ABR2M155_9ASPA
MECLSWTYGFRLLRTNRSSHHSYRNISHSKLSKSLSWLDQLHHRATVQSKPRPLVFCCDQFSDSRSVGSFVTHSYARDVVIPERQNTEAIPNPSPDLVSESFGTRIFRDEYLWSAFEIAEAVGGEIVRWGPSGTISTDTRTLLPGQWFFAISGANSDGHDFVNEALGSEMGCVGVIGNRLCRNWENGFIKVDGDPNLALEKMAKFARNRFSGVVVCLTGSVGKTTTRTMITLALSSLGRVYQTCGNLNSMVGVALTLIGIPLDAKAAVVEVGMSRKREILTKARICRPSVRVILNVGHCHLEYLRSLENVAEAKGEILVEAKPGDICVMNGDDPLVMSLYVPPGVRKVLFGRGVGCDVRLVSAENIDGGRAVRVILENHMSTSINHLKAADNEIPEMAEFRIHGPGLHLAMNACAAAAVALSLGVPLPQISESLSRFRPVPMRSQMLVTRSGITVMNDVYNASPLSMAAAIQSLKSMDCAGKRVCILGDMLELGPTEFTAHEAVLELCRDSSIGLIMLAGKRFLAAAKKLKLVDAVCALDAEAAASKASEFLALGDVVLVKGSGGMEMGKVVSAINEIGGNRVSGWDDFM